MRDGNNTGKRFRFFLTIFALCGCVGVSGFLNANTRLAIQIPGNFSKDLVDGSASTLVCVARKGSENSKKSYLQDTYLLRVYNVKTGKQSIAQVLSVKGRSFQAIQAWTYGEGALVYGYTQEHPGKINRKYSLLIVTPTRIEHIVLAKPRYPRFFDEKSGLFGYVNRSVSPVIVSFISITEKSLFLEDRIVKEDFFHAETDSDGTVYLFSNNKDSLGISRYLLPGWTELWHTKLPLQWDARIKVNQVNNIICIDTTERIVGIETETGKSSLCPDIIDNAIATVGDKYVVKKGKDGIAITSIHSDMLKQSH